LIRSHGGASVEKWMIDYLSRLIKDNKMLKWLGIILISLMLVLGVASVIFYVLHKPSYSGARELPGLTAGVEIFYDKAGVPHIYAQQETDAYFALGYVHAQDRLFQMEMLRRAGAGRLAEVIGEKALKADQLFRTLGISRFASEHAKKFLASDSLPFQRAAHAYQKGVNHFIATGPTPVEFLLMGIPKQPFTDADFYHVVGIMAFGFAEGVRTDPVLQKIKTELGDKYLRDLAVQTPADAEKIPVFKGEPNRKPLDSLIVQLDQALSAIPIPLWQGSNGWAISGSRTASGLPILANDTHMGFSQPAVWYEVHLSYPGFEFYGHHVAGLPFGLLGQNDFCAWGLTMFENDDTDFFVDFSDFKQAEGGSENDQYQTTTEVIRVKDRPDVPINIVDSPWGVWLGDEVEHVPAADKNRPTAFYWQLTHQTNTALQAAYQLNHARSFTDAETAASLFTAPGLNVMYADRAGNIAWWAAAKLPVRDAAVEPKLFLASDNPQHQYGGFHPFSENPQSVNPPWGFVYSANNQPDSVAGVLYPGYYFPKYRAGRIRALLSEEKRWTVEDVKKVILDATTEAHVELARVFAAVLARSSNPAHQPLAAILMSWDGSHPRTSTAPSVFYNLLAATLQGAMEDELRPEAYRTLMTTSLMKDSRTHLISNPDSPWWDNLYTGMVESRQHVIEQAADVTLQRLRANCGPTPEEWTWDKIHTVTHPHVLAAVKPLDKIFNVGPFPADGGDEVINNLQFNLDSTGFFPVKGGPALRKITDLGDWQRGVTISPSGQSGNLFSQYYDDQAERYVQGAFRTMYMNRVEIEKVAAHRLMLTPAQ
jgi:penicillin amidase